MRRIALAAVLVTSAAAAKSDQAVGTDESQMDAPIAVRGTLDGTTARLVVDYRIETLGGPEVQTTALELTMPTGAVVTGATITQGGATHRMTLDEIVAVGEQFGDAFGDEGKIAPTTWVAKIALNTYLGPSYGVSVVIGAPIRTDVLLSLEVTERLLPPLLPLKVLKAFQAQRAEAKGVTEAYSCITDNTLRPITIEPGQDSENLDSIKSTTTAQEL